MTKMRLMEDELKSICTIPREPDPKEFVMRCCETSQETKTQEGVSRSV